MKEENLNAILIPTKMRRQPPFLKRKEYKDDKRLIEEPREIYLSSAFWKSHWMWNKIRLATKDFFHGDSVLFATDYAITLKHNIRTFKQMQQAKDSSDPMTFDMEYNNLMLGGSDNQYYSYDLVSDAQKIKKAWYPRTTAEYFDTTKLDKHGNRVKIKSWFGDIEKKKDEVRVISIDIAMGDDDRSNQIKNDFSVIKCIRALKNGEKYDKQEVYTESSQGDSAEKQAVRIRQIYDDFDADYIVLDARNFGLNIFDEFAKVLYDEERDKEYDPIKCFNEQRYANRCKNENALPIVYAFVGSAERNDNMHKLFKGALMTGKYKMLIPHAKCIDEVLGTKNEWNLGSPSEKARYEKPYVLSDLTLTEMINLSMEFIGTGKAFIQLKEPNNGTKDKYISSAMGNYFIQELEQELTKKNDGEYDDDDVCVYF